MKYDGYKGIALDGFSIKSLKVLSNTLSKISIKVDELIKIFNTLDSLSLDEVKSATKKFYADYLSINDVLAIDSEEAKKYFDYISSSQNGEEFYSRVNALLKPISPFDLDIHLVDGMLLTGKVHKPLIISPDDLDEDIRKVYFEYIEIGKTLNLLSVPIYAHEIMHTQVDQRIGAVEDALNAEVLSIFIEKIAANEINSTGMALKLCERERIAHLSLYLKTLMLPDSIADKEDKFKSLMYIKSILIANKLFDMYISERKPKNKDKYFDDINSVISGNMTVEELINKRDITIAKCQDYGLILRHI